MLRQLVVVLSALVAVASAVKTEVQLDRFEQTKGFGLANATGIRVRKFNRTAWALTGEGEVFQDMGDEYWFTLTLAYSRLGNNQFIQHPFKIKKDKACDVLNGVYKDYQHYFVDYSNMPRIEDGTRFCPFPKGHYWVKDWAPDSGWVPPAIPEGYWRMTADVMDEDGEVLIQLIAYMHIRRGLT